MGIGSTQLKSMQKLDQETIIIRKQLSIGYDAVINNK